MNLTPPKWSTIYVKLWILCIILIILFVQWLNFENVRSRIYQVHFLRLQPLTLSLLSTRIWFPIPSLMETFYLYLSRLASDMIYHLFDLSPSLILDQNELLPYKDPSPVLSCHVWFWLVELIAQSQSQLKVAWDCVLKQPILVEIYI